MKPAPKTSRLFVMITDEQRAWLETQAVDRGVSIATVVREAIDAKRRNNSERQET